MKPKPPDQVKHWFASHRRNRDGTTWQAYNPATEQWEPTTYEQVPDALWGMRFRRDGWTFYTDRTRECDEHGFPAQAGGAR